MKPDRRRRPSPDFLGAIAGILGGLSCAPSTIPPENLIGWTLIWGAVGLIVGAIVGGRGRST